MLLLKHTGHITSEGQRQSLIIGETWTSISRVLHTCSLLQWKHSLLEEYEFEALNFPPNTEQCVDTKDKTNNKNKINRKGRDIKKRAIKKEKRLSTDVSYLHTAVLSSKRLIQPKGCTCLSPPETCHKRKNNSGRQPPPKSSYIRSLPEVNHTCSFPQSPGGWELPTPLHLPICL